MISSKKYLERAKALLDSGSYTDGCTTPFKNYIHRYLKKAFLFCAAHDYGSLGLIEGVRGGWHNNLHTLIAHWSQANPLYWIWGTIVALVTLPWVVFRRDLNQKWMPFIPFHVVLLFCLTVPILIKYSG